MITNPIDILPINGGNALQVHEYLNAIQGNKLELYLILLDQLRYERNLFTIQNDDDLAKVWSNIETCLYWQGVCAIKKIDDLITVYQLSDIEVNSTNQIIKAKGKPFITMSNRSSNLKDEKLTLDNAVFFKRNNEGWSDWVFWYYRYEQLIEIKKYIFVNLQGSQKKVIINTQGENTDIVRKEIEHLKNTDNWWIAFNTITDLPIRNISEDFKELNIPNESEQLFYAFDKWLNFIYYHKGRRYNVSSKAERNVVDEVQINTVNFDLMEKDKMDCLKLGIEHYNKIYNRNAEIIKTFELLENEVEMEERSIEEAQNDQI